MTFILVEIEALREAQARYTEAIISMIGMREDLREASRMAWGSEGDFCERVMAIEAKAAAQLQRIENDAVEARDYLQRKADEFERADRDAEEAMGKLAGTAGGLPLIPGWLWSGEAPPGYLADDWKALPGENKLAIEQEYQRQLQAWIAQLIAEGRLATATLEEFEDRLRGVQKVWAWTNLNVRASAGADALRVGGLSPYQVAEWTMGVAFVDGTKWYEVIYRDKDNCAVRGWVSGKYLAEYAYVNPDFVGPQMIDLSVPDEVVQPPSDPGLANAARFHYRHAPQYMEVEPPVLDEHGNIIAHGAARPHNNLCGEIAAAGVLGEDVKDVLKRWETDPSTRATAAAILNDPGEGTLRDELTAIFEISGRETTDHDGFLSPVNFQDQLSTGRRFVAGVGLNTGTGEIGPGGAGHWIVVEEVIPAGNGGWVRVLQSHIIHPPGYFDDTSHVVMLEEVVPWEQF